MKDGKAAGILGVPAEAFKYAATSATRALYPLVLKIFATAECPLASRLKLYAANPKKGPS